MRLSRLRTHGGQHYEGEDNDNVPGGARPGDHCHSCPGHCYQWYERSMRLRSRRPSLLAALHHYCDHRRWRVHLTNAVSLSYLDRGGGRSSSPQPFPRMLPTRSRWDGLRSVPCPLGLDAGAGVDVSGGHVLHVGGWGDASL
jgi:hypothetical protein